MLLIALTTLARGLFIAATGLTDTESYYVSWARFPSWSYYDHAPATAWLVWLVTRIFRTPSATRLIPVACAALQGWLVYRLGERLFSPRAGFIAASVMTALPAFFFIGFLVNPEGPLGPLWVWYLLLLYELRVQREAWRPAVLGAVLGAAFLCKYTGILLLPVTLGFVLTTPSARGWLRRPAFYLGGVVALVVASPVIGWNALHGWPTIGLHLTERMPPVGLVALSRHALKFAVGQALTFHPLILPGLLVALVWCLGKARDDDRFRLLTWAVAPVGVFLAMVMIRASDAESHWTMVAYLPLTVAAGAWLDLHLERAGAGLKTYAVASVMLSLGFIAVCLVHTQTPALAEALPGYDAPGDPMNEAQGWPEVRQALQNRAASLGPRVAVVGSHNVLCGHLLMALDDTPEVYCASPRRTEFDFIGRRTAPPDVTVLYVDSLRYPLDPARILPNRRCRDVDHIDVHREGLSVGRFRIAECSPEEPDALHRGSGEVALRASNLR